jgi:hypothetical protein
MFVQVFITTYAIGLGIVCAAATAILAAALLFWIFMNIKEKLSPKPQVRRTSDEDDWIHKPIGGWGE